MIWFMSILFFIIGLVFGNLSKRVAQADDTANWFKNHLRDVKKEMGENEFVSYTFAIEKGKDKDDDEGGDSFPVNPYEDAFRNN